MILYPVHDRVIVKKDEPETKTSGGILIPETAHSTVTKGTVLAVGPGKYSTKTAQLIPMSAKTGDTVLFHPAAGSTLKVDGQTLHVMTDADVWCVIENDETSASS